MSTSIAAAMRVLERGDLAAAERAFADVTGGPRDAVIARFRRAECLSRLGRHDEAIAEARVALRDGPAESATWVWLVHCLAEAGRFDEAISVEIPREHAEELTTIRAGYAALAKLAANDRADAAKTMDAILDTRHEPLYSLALRIAESRRLRAEPRWPDLPSIWYAHECRMEMEHDKETEHPAPPSASNPGKAVRWLHLHWSCADYREFVAALRETPKPPEQLDECELEQHLAFGRIDEAFALAQRIVKEAGDDAGGELCIALARIAQVRGDPASPSRFPGWDDARLRLKASVAWLELGAALLSDRPLDARPLADRVADPSHREYVEAALLRWGRSPILNPPPDTRPGVAHPIAD
jgi:tetratricopeptide (TPR) repeat protein